MPSIPQTRSFPISVLVLIGVAAFALGLLATMSTIGPHGAHAQDQCDPTQPGGCPIPLNSSATNAITYPSQSDTWTVDVEVTNDFFVTLTNLPGEYEETVYGPDGSLLTTADG